ncbi:glycosyltransferase family 2 protein [Pleurocapsales cyanobacterium LEGE 10410]|nr:glycosyltransferase family 2 protein [Pleurocapsales cyanobacterium LEGE 10410]
MNNISVCTIYAKRKLHLQNLVKGLIKCQSHPDELAIVCMNDRLLELPQTPFAIKSACINTNNSYLPLAVARNKAAAIATGEKLIFLDVDCIADRHLIDIFNYHLQQEDALYSGSVRYLHSRWQQANWSENCCQLSLGLGVGLP